MNPVVKFDYVVNEISFELFGNTFYDINGEKQDHLISLVQSIPIKSITETSKNNDLLDMIGFNLDDINGKEYCKDFLLDVVSLLSKTREIFGKKLNMVLIFSTMMY